MNKNLLSMMKYVFFLCLLLSTLIAQAEVPQYVVTNKGDTIEASKLFFTEHKVVIKTPAGEKKIVWSK